MSRYVVLSVNHNVDYMYFLPLTVWSWEKAGWDVLVYYRGEGHSDVERLVITQMVGDENVYYTHPVPGIRDATISQVSRLYAACLSSIDDNDYLLLGDCDMLALGDHWNPDYTKVTVYNHDLTGFGEIPMCYVGGTKKLWKQIMNLEGITYNEAIKRDIENYPNAKDQDFYKWWGCDQQILTARLKEYGTGKIDFINRGQYSNGFAKGRVDRGSWSLKHEVLIDAHLEQQTWQNDEKIRRLFELLHHAFPKEDFLWFASFTKEFKKLAV